MAKKPETVFDFLTDLEEKLKPMGEAERKKLLELKKSEHEKRGLDFDGTFYLWDYRYYDRLWTERELNLGGFMKLVTIHAVIKAPHVCLTSTLAQTRTKSASISSSRNWCPRFSPCIDKF
jgi:hypothetical protein